MKEEKEKNDKRKEFVVQIGPLLKNVLEKQKQNVAKIEYLDALNLSFYEAGEIIAKKIMENKLI